MHVKTRRILMSVAGTTIVAVGVGLMRFAAFGVDPFTVLMSGLDRRIPIPYGTLYVIVNLTMLLFSLLTERKYIGLGTVLNLCFTGYIAEFILGLMQGLFPTAGFALRGAVLICSLLILCFGSSIYMTADLGVSAYDAVALVMANKWHLWKFKYLRICTDLVCVVAGIALFLMGGGKVSQIPTIVGVGSVITAFFMGPTIAFFGRWVSRWLEENTSKKTERGN